VKRSRLATGTSIGPDLRHRAGRWRSYPGVWHPTGELYVTSKLGIGNHRPDDVRRSFDETLEKLGLDYLDLFLIHRPLPTLYSGDYV
jgi:aryl-alcohol dehydrogenase-like predicted oxidoreductase